MMWQIATYQPTTLFSLRPFNATSSGGKTLLTPTPYTVKMALLDAAIRCYGREKGRAWFPALRDLQVAVELPEVLVVSNTFVRILRPNKAGEMGSNITYREMVHFGGQVRLAFSEVREGEDVPPLGALLAQVYYLGKRGGFFQFLEGTQSFELPESYTLLTEAYEETGFTINGMLQMMDDCGPKMTFDHADVYQKSKRVGLHKPDGRVIHTVILPYRLVRSSHAFSFYHRGG